MSAPVLITPPTAWPVTLAEAKLHLRVDHDSDDALITALIQAATQDAEAEMHRAILPQTWRLQLDAWPRDNVVRLWPARVTGVTSMTYIDTDGVEQTLAPSGRQLSADDLGARLAPSWGTSWPVLRNQIDAVSITYTAGTWATPADVPALVRQWILLRLGDHYDMRSTVQTAQAPLPYVSGLLDRWRVHTL